MDWIKKNYEKFSLLLLALALAGVSVFLILSARSFLTVFDSIHANVIHNNNIPALDTGKIEEAKVALQKSPVWSGHPGSLFVSRKYLIKEGALYDPLEPTQGGTTLALHPPIPNAWFIKYNLDLLDSDILDQDPDGDGFTNLEEWKNLKGDGSDSTDPTDKNSHPPYYTKLRLEKYIREHFLMLFAAYDGDPAKPDSLTFQINAITAGKPSQFLKMGDTIAGTKFKITKFELKKFTDANDVIKDVSELTVEHSDTGEKVVMVLDKLADSPDSYALFKYLWNNTELKVKKDKEFSLAPEEDQKYKLVDIQEQEAVIESLKTHEQIKVPHLEEPK